MTFEVSVFDQPANASTQDFPKNAKQLLARIQGRGWEWLALMLKVKPVPFIFTGGALTNVLFNLNPTYSNHDVDVFVCHSDPVQLRDKVEVILNFTKAHYPEMKMFVIQNSLWLQVSKDEPYYNITATLTDNSFEIIKNFDLAFVSAFFDGDRLMATMDCMQAWTTKTMMFESKVDLTNKDEIQIEYYRKRWASRIQKAVSKGFEVKSSLNLTDAEMKAGQDILHETDKFKYAWSPSLSFIKLVVEHIQLNKPGDILLSSPEPVVKPIFEPILSQPTTSTNRKTMPAETESTVVENAPDFKPENIQKPLVMIEKEVQDKMDKLSSQAKPNQLKVDDKEPAIQTPKDPFIAQVKTVFEAVNEITDQVVGEEQKPDDSDGEDLVTDKKPEVAVTREQTLKPFAIPSKIKGTLRGLRMRTKKIEDWLVELEDDVKDRLDKTSLQAKQAKPKPEEKVSAGVMYPESRTWSSSIGSTSITTVDNVTTGSCESCEAYTVQSRHGGTGFSVYSNGQMLIGNSATGTLTKATLTAGKGISIENGRGQVTISLNESFLDDRVENYMQQESQAMWETMFETKLKAMVDATVETMFETKLKEMQATVDSTVETIFKQCMETESQTSKKIADEEKFGKMLKVHFDLTVMDDVVNPGQLLETIEKTVQHPGFDWAQRTCYGSQETGWQIELCALMSMQIPVGQIVDEILQVKGVCGVAYVVNGVYDETGAYTRTNPLLIIPKPDNQINPNQEHKENPQNTHTDKTGKIDKPVEKLKTSSVVFEVTLDEDNDNDFVKRAYSIRLLIKHLELYFPLQKFAYVGSPSFNKVRLEVVVTGRDNEHEPHTLVDDVIDELEQLKLVKNVAIFSVRPLSVHTL